MGKELREWKGEIEREREGNSEPKEEIEGKIWTQYKSQHFIFKDSGLFDSYQRFTF